MLSSQVWTLVLVAGKSERFEGIKALAPWREGTLLSNALLLAKEVSHDNVCVVVGKHAEVLQAELGKTHFTYNPNWEQGMGASIAWGVQNILAQDASAQAIVILPVDQPFIPVQHLQALIEQSKSKSKCILSAGSDQTFGPPAVLHRDFFNKAAALQGKKGLKAFLNESDYETIFDAMSLEDIDTQDDLRRLHSKMEE